MISPIQHLGLKPGIYYDVSEEHYHGDLLMESPTLSRSEAIVLVDESPLHCWTKHPRLAAQAKKSVTPAMDFGNTVHKLALGRGTEVGIVDADDWRTKDAKAARDSYHEQGITPILKKDYDEARVIVGALDVRLNEFGLAERFNQAKSEVVLLWQESEKCFCRAMADKLLIDEEAGTAEFFDVKVTDSACPTFLGKHFVNMGYGAQNSFYERGLGKLRPDLAGRIKFTFILQENFYPYVMLPVQLTGAFMAASKSKMDRAVARWTECITTGKWPGYSDKIFNLEPPPWLIAQEMGSVYGQ